MRNNKFPWNCGDCPMLKTYDMSIDDLTHICLWSKKQIDDCDRYKSAECPLEKHDSELLDKVAEKFIAWDSKVKGTREDNVCFFTIENILKGIEEMKAEVSK